MPAYLCLRPRRAVQKVEAAAGEGDRDGLGTLSNEGKFGQRLINTKRLVPLS